MAGSAKFATDEMREIVRGEAQDIENYPGPQGVYGDMVGAGLVPESLPCEAYALWDSQGYLHAAASEDGMNAWYFHCNASELPYWSDTTYTAQDPQGNEISVCEGDAIAKLISNEQTYFYINGERFTLSGPKEPPDDTPCYTVACTGPPGRGAMATFDTAGTGVSVHVFSTSAAVRTEERMGLEKIGPDFKNDAVDPRGDLPKIIARHIQEGTNPFYYTAPGE